MRLRYPGHTCVVVEVPSMDIFTCMRIVDRERDGNFLEEDEDEEEEDGRNGDEEEDEADDDESDEEKDYSNGKREDIFKVYHSLGNDREMHMMATSQVQPAGYTFPMKLLKPFRHLEASNGQWVPVDEFCMDGAIDAMMFGDLVECKYGK